MQILLTQYTIEAVSLDQVAMTAPARVHILIRSSIRKLHDDITRDGLNLMMRIKSNLSIRSCLLTVLVDPIEQDLDLALDEGVQHLDFAFSEEWVHGCSAGSVYLVVFLAAC